MLLMTKAQAVADAVKQLSAEELDEFRTWFAEFDAAVWDRQFEADVAAGRLDALAEEIEKDFRQGRCQEL